MKKNNTKKGAFTLIELIIVMIVIVILSALIIPSLIAAKLSANETSGIANLRQIATSQELFRFRTHVDEDNDGTGEYGGLVEMAGTQVGRAASAIVPPVLSPALGVLNATGQASRSGYLYAVFLPDATGAGLVEPQTGYTTTTLDVDLSENVYAVYVWPVVHNQSGSRTFFINQQGIMTFTDGVYDSATVPAYSAAFLAAGSLTNNIAVNVVGADGNTWKAVN